MKPIKNKKRIDPRYFLNEKDDLESRVRTALSKEGGAAGLDALVKHTGATEEEIKSALSGWEGIGIHPDGDYILQGGDIKIASESKEPGLWANIKAKKDRIKAGSGEKKARPGDKDYPATLDIEEDIDESIVDKDYNEPMDAGQILLSLQDAVGRHGSGPEMAQALRKIADQIDNSHGSSNKKTTAPYGDPWSAYPGDD